MYDDSSRVILSQPVSRINHSVGVFFFLAFRLVLGFPDFLAFMRASLAS